MTNNEHAATAAEFEIGSHFTLAADFAAKKSLSAEATYVVIGERKIGRNDFFVAAEIDVDSDVIVENAKNFNVQQKNMIEILPREMTEDEIIEEIVEPRKSAHAACAHAKTKTARATCRRERAKNNES
jgi:hypothetical protein